MKLKKVEGLKGTISIPGDKSISHRAVMFGSLAKGTTHITNFLSGADCLATIDCFRAMGVRIEQDGTEVTVHGNGLHGSESGIMMRPMGRIMIPLSVMGAEIESVSGNGCAPLRINGKPLKAVHYESPVASAQVKSAVLLAGLYADGRTSVTEPALSRNHTELMLKSFGVQVLSEGTTASVMPPKEMTATDIAVPGDISSAAFFIAAGLVTPDSCITLKQVGINPTRNGIIKVCEAMGADLTMSNVKDDNGEPTADITVKTSRLKGTEIGGELIPTLIDEIPVIALMAAFAEGETVIKDAAELKVKESNRIDLTVDNLVKMGVNAEATDDGMIIRGGNPLRGVSIHCKYDHRIAMTFSVAGINAQGTTVIEDAECVDVSYPNFYEQLHMLAGQ